MQKALTNSRGASPLLPAEPQAPRKLGRELRGDPLASAPATRLTNHQILEADPGQGQH